ncbi:reverse transcriptase [Plakobranchus ocellatus]|uniref:Reverse transcriptase n=1 Tax=Plakobranchus ocellatus TaxID=259542 RepID=A0AAV3Y0S6_9GAST|nr:reverse transcriptase [Plakobranchus ocellatus]
MRRIRSACPAKGEDTSVHIRKWDQSWCGSGARMDTQRKSLLDGCDDWDCSADLSEWNRYRKVIQDTGMRPDIMLH